jgi:hypothetical protein
MIRAVNTTPMQFHFVEGLGGRPLSDSKLASRAALFTK